jgi:hypothetical protein
MLQCFIGEYWRDHGIDSVVVIDESRAMKVDACDFDLDLGNVSNRRLLIDRRPPLYRESHGMVLE